MYGRFEGELDDNEDLAGSDNVFEFPIQKMVYRGEFHENEMHGQGEIEHTDTGNVFRGQFANGDKHGPAKFILAEAKKFGDNKTGIFEDFYQNQKFVFDSTFRRKWKICKSGQISGNFLVLTHIFHDFRILENEPYLNLQKAGEGTINQDCFHDQTFCAG